MINKFPKIFKELLIDNDLNQSKIAELLNTTQPTISNWLKGLYQPDIETIYRICYYLKTTPNELLGWNELGINDLKYQEYYLHNREKFDDENELAACESRISCESPMQKSKESGIYDGEIENPQELFEWVEKNR